MMDVGRAHTTRPQTTAGTAAPPVRARVRHRRLSRSTRRPAARAPARC